MARKPKATEAPPAPTQPRQGFVPAGQAAALLMLSTQRLRQLSAEGFIPRASKGEYPLVGVVQGYIRFLKDEERRTSKVQAESDLKATRRKEIELRIARDDHRLIETDEAIAAVEDIVGIHRSEIAGVPAAVTRDLTLRRKIEAELDGVFARTHARLAERAHALRTGGEAVPPESPDDV